MVVDDHAAVREGVKMILARDREISVIGESASGTRPSTMADRRRPDVVLMDVRMRGWTDLRRPEIRPRIPTWR